MTLSNKKENLSVFLYSLADLMTKHNIIFSMGDGRSLTIAVDCSCAHVSFLDWTWAPEIRELAESKKEQDDKGKRQKD